ncbi:hypothetical protein GCM10025856_03450 [Methylophaga marina]|uniref:ABC transporter permease n=1 Tax=Methylophaga marina TaxID=45495 RepID=A0ABP3CZS5_9GAMM|nr:hypothetical protein [Methylophaga marina]BDZ72626.1 hypothetical protein GCM10025856_03450 [Methylophaga marina]
MNLFYRIGAVLEYRYRSLVFLAVGIIAATLFGQFLGNILSNIQHGDNAMLISMYPALRLLYIALYLFVFFMAFYVSFKVFKKDWDTFHRIY